MSVREKLASLPDAENWNHPSWPKYIPWFCAALGAVVGNIFALQTGVHPPVGAGIGAAVAVFIVIPVLAVID